MVKILQVWWDGKGMCRYRKWGSNVKILRIERNRVDIVQWGGTVLVLWDEEGLCTSYILAL